MTLPTRTPAPADIILSQLGGRRRLSTMTGAKDIFSDNDGYTLVFKIGPGAKNGINYVRIHLNSMDTYDVTFSKITRRKDRGLGIFVPHLVEISKEEGLYNDMLVNHFVSETGFHLTL